MDNPYQAPQADTAPNRAASMHVRPAAYTLLIGAPSVAIGAAGWMFGASQSYGSLGLLFAVSFLLCLALLAAAKKIVGTAMLGGLVVNALFFVIYRGRGPGMPLLGFLVLVIISTSGALLLGSVRLACVHSKSLVLRLIFLFSSAFLAGWYCGYFYTEWRN